jgi:hypothetical protein
MLLPKTPTSLVAPQNQTWVTDVHCETRDAAMVDFTNAKKTVDVNQEHHERKCPEFKFRTNQDRHQSVTCVEGELDSETRGIHWPLRLVGLPSYQ